jgi:hypothetical protein
MQESDTYLMILDEGQQKATREGILVIGEDRFGPPKRRCVFNWPTSPTCSA